jgi:hypothetical protein
MYILIIFFNLNCMNFSSILQQWIATIAIHRDNYGDKSVSKNDAIFCNPLY